MLSLACLPASGSAQQPASNQPALLLKVHAREVLLPVTVRDKHGALVTGLKASDFTLTEDNRPQTIKSFTPESNLPYRLGLLVDTSRGVFAAMDSERKAAGKFVDLMLPASPREGTEVDQAFLIHFDNEVELLEDFTKARDKLRRELDEMGPTRGEDASQRSQAGGDDSRGNARGMHGAGTQLYDAIYLACDELMKPRDGRKALVVFSNGLDRGSMETLNDAVDAADRANVAVYTIYFKGEQERGMDNGLPGERRRGGSERSLVDSRKIMEQIATRTGARYFDARKKDNLDNIYNQIAEELRGQYLLTYTPDLVDNDGGYHKIALKADKDNLEVVTREGYYAPDGSAK
jgi:VWFA-related protein